MDTFGIVLSIILFGGGIFVSLCEKGGGAGL